MAIKVIALIRSGNRKDSASLSQSLQSVASVLLQTFDVDHCVVNVADRQSPWAKSKEGDVPLYDAIVELPLKGEPAIVAESLRGQLARNAEVHVYLADQSVIKKPTVDSTPSINLMAVWDAKRGQAAAETRHHWREHVPLAVSIHHGATRYVQSWLEKPLTQGAPAHAGVATLRFPSMEVMARGLFRSAEDVATIDQDVAEFIQTSHVLYTTETVVVRESP
jgi:EthD domain-containing protein